MLGSVQSLEEAIRSSVRIPVSLSNNIRFRTTGLGGVFIEYKSDSRGGVASMNSTTQFTIMFITTDGAGRYTGDNIGVEMTHCINIKSMRGIKKLQPYEKVVAKVNKWLSDNESYLFNCIQY